MKQPVLRYILFFSALVAMAGCLPSAHYQKEYSIPKNQWSSDYKPTFRFEVTDTTVAYRFYFIMRHSEAYPYANIWVWLNIKQPGDSTFHKRRIEVPLAEQSGKWLGRGMGEMWEHRMPITQNNLPVKFDKPGIYEIKLQQNMRVNPLPEVFNVGLRVEKDTRRNFSAQ